ncbi:MAG: DUF424 family protein [Candidatus Bathyarchaeia archaeon]
MDRIYVKKYVKGEKTLVTVCDSELIGKTLREGRLRLEVSSSFYKGELATKEEAIAALSKADTGNLVGEKSVRAAVDGRLVDPSAVIYIAGVPHVQIIRL